MTQVTQERQGQTYLADFAALERSGQLKGPAWAAELRQAAMAIFAERGFPTRKDEDWKYTDVSPLAQRPFRVAVEHRRNGALGYPPWLRLAEAGAARLLLVDGHAAPEHSSLSSLPAGVQVRGLAQVVEEEPELIEPHLGRHALADQSPFVALNTAFVRDGALVYLPRGSVVDAPIHLVFLSQGGDERAASHPRTLIVLERDARATVVETYASLAQGECLTNAVTEVVVDEGASLEHCKLVVEGPGTFYLGTTQVLQRRDSRFGSFLLSLGSRLVRNDLNVVLGDEGCTATLHGFSVAGGQQHVDNHTLIDHARPHGTSRQLYKGLWGGSSTGVFNGKIVVRPRAQATDAEQTNRNLLLSEGASVDTKPQLEIFADDVRCTHGATVGQLDAEALFYLESRGLSRTAAARLLAYGFAADLINRVPMEGLRSALDAMVLERVEAAFRAGEMV